MAYATKEGAAANARRFYAKRRAMYLEGQSCRACGSTENLEIHHKDPSTKVDNRIFTWAIPRLEEELAKCEWLCGACHDEHHAALLRAPCGSAAAYQRGCRCQACRDAHASRARAYAPRRSDAARLRDRERHTEYMRGYRARQREARS